jgi:hypothetical protein
MNTLVFGAGQLGAGYRYTTAQVVKRRKGGRVVPVTTKIIFGSEEAVQAR